MFAPVQEQWVCGRYGPMSEKQKANFFAKIDGDPFHATECALWTGCRRSKTQKGNQHGLFRYNREMVSTHVLMFHNFVGPLPINYGKPGGLCVLHTCDTDGRCVNINHLYLGTKRQNAIDMVRDGNHHNQKLTPARVREIRILLAEGNLTQIAIAKQYDVHKSTISSINTGYGWGWLQ
jgi:hypothetical protein